MSERYKNILVIKPSSLGDIVMALPALAALRRNFPDARISWLIKPEFSAILEGHEYIDQLIPFDRKFLGRAWRDWKSFSALVGLIRRLRRERFDAIVDLQGLFRTGCLGWLSGCRKRFGMAGAREFGNIFYNYRVEQGENCVHVVDYYIKMVGAMGAGDLKVDFAFAEDKAAEQRVKELLGERRIDRDNYAVLIPGSAQESKCWPTERYAALADRLGGEFGLQIVAVGTKSESGVIEDIIERSNVDIVNLAGETNLGELTSLLRGARMVVGNDTGPSHIAACLGVGVVIIYGWSNPWRISPYGRNECMAAGGLESRGIKIKSELAEHSVAAVSVDEVFEKVSRQLR